MIDERRSLEERIGTTVASGSLKSDPMEDAGARERIGALGAAVLKLPRGQVADGPSKWDDRRRLAELLWRAKYGGDTVSAHQAARLFGWWLSKHDMPYLQMFPIFIEGRYHPSLGLLFCARSIVEWIHDKCPACGGTGTQGVEPEEASRNVVRYRVCSTCEGTRRFPVDHLARILALGIQQRAYEKHWAVRFTIAQSLLTEISRSINYALARQLSRRGLAHLSE